MQSFEYAGEGPVLMDNLKGAARRQNDSVEHHLLTSGTGDAYQSVAASYARKVKFQRPCGTAMMDKWISMSVVSGKIIIGCKLSANVDQAFKPSWERKGVSMLC